MAQTSPELTQLPTQRDHPCPFDPPAVLGELREKKPLTRLAFPDGHVGWVVTGYSLARQVLTDARFSARQELRHIPVEITFGQELSGPARPGFFSHMDPPEHTRYRQLLAGQFTVRRMNRLVPQVEEIVETYLDALESNGTSADLMAEFALPVSTQVVCELLGVPASDSGMFQQLSAVAFGADSTPEEVANTMATAGGYIYQLIQRKRAEPTDDMLSGLINDSDLTDEEVIGVATFFLAGPETTSSQLALGIFALLENPDQLAALRGDLSLIGKAVEELLRYLSVLNVSTTRGALEDVELEGELIAAGETVVISVPTANRDPERFADPDSLDITRSATGHLTFGHGIHQCLAHQLVRVVVQTAYLGLLRRFPDLRLAVPATDIPMRGDLSVHGVQRLPVTWAAPSPLPTRTEGDTTNA